MPSRGSYPGEGPEDEPSGSRPIVGGSGRSPLQRGPMTNQHGPRRLAGPSMKRYRATVEYDGTSYHGWQLQKNLPTVQGTLEQTLARILGITVRVHGAGRTDAGVHARGQVIHFDAEWSHPPEALQRGWNALLPRDVAVRDLCPAHDGFHARHSARCKTYKYYILNRTLRSPLHRLHAWHVPFPLDLTAMEEAAAVLKGVHDFAAFGSPTDGTPSTVREILHAGWESDPTEGMLIFTVCGTGFLRYMVRSLVGTLVLVGSGKINPVQFREILASRDRAGAGPTAPANGLCLESVEYGFADSTVRSSP